MLGLGQRFGKLAGSLAFIFFQDFLSEDGPVSFEVIVVGQNFQRLLRVDHEDSFLIKAFQN